MHYEEQKQFIILRSLSKRNLININDNTLLKHRLRSRKI